jgi:tetratricopeptide (TPR) repeat protein
VQDLHYGDVLFRFYTGDEFEALTRLEAYQHWDRMPNHRDDAALLGGGLYLSLGMHNEAGKRFELLLGDRVPAAVRDRAWFYLAKVWYARGYYDRSEASLGRISGTLPSLLEAERQHLLVNDLMRQGRFDEASARLASWQGPLDWMAYARFNLGVALVRQNRMNEADPVLTAVGTMAVRSEELLGLRDKANLALGFAWLQAGNATAGRTALLRVRLAGPYASRALLGVGWASAALGDYNAALTPWMALRERNLQDAAVQEGLLAVPYAFGKLGAGGQAAEYYESAIKSFGAEADTIDDSIARIGTGHMLDDLLAAQPQQPSGLGPQRSWFWQLQQLPQNAEARYLYPLLADNDFQEGLKNYRDIGFLGGTLARWDESMDAFATMIDTRQLAEQRRLPHADALLAQGAAAQLLSLRTQLDTRLTNIETDDDVAALGNTPERAQWARVRRLEAALASASGDPDELRTEREKIRLMKGVLYWRLDEKFKERSYAGHRALRSLDAALNEAQNRFVRVRQARASVPDDVGGFGDRIGSLAARISVLRDQLKEAAAAQERYLERLAQDELLAQKDRLDAYQVQARFALADIYDRAGNAPAAKPPVALPRAELPPGEPPASAPAQPAPGATP